MKQTVRHRASWRTAAAVLMAAGACSVAGCSSNGSPFAIIAQAVPQYIAAAYPGLAGQRVAVMVYAEPGVRADYPDLTIDAAGGIQTKLVAAQSDPKPKDLIGTTFPIRPDSIARFQEDHPELENAPVTQTAARLNVDRLIYVEINSFATRSEASLDLYHGNVLASVQVVEIGPTSAKVVYQDPGVKISFPKDDPKEGEPDGSDSKVYTNTLDAFTTDIAQRFYKHDAPDD